MITCGDLLASICVSQAYLFFESYSEVVKTVLELGDRDNLTLSNRISALNIVGMLAILSD